MSLALMKDTVLRTLVDLMGAPDGTTGEISAKDIVRYGISFLEKDCRVVVE